MAWAVDSSGTVTTNGTEQTLVNDTTTNSTFQFSFEKHNMAAGDQVTVRIYKMVVGDTVSRIVYQQSFSGVAAANDVVAVSPALASTNGLKVTIQRDLGVDRSYVWELITA